ncbi:MAG: copper oxidase [Nanohaloarchaea archaeon SW_7_46_7]|nr:MAG: copper oxidase [Nanohaloarchaea archaeon SW_7_46_7]
MKKGFSGLMVVFTCVLFFVSGAFAHSTGGGDVQEFEKAPATQNAEVPVPEEKCPNANDSWRQAQSFYGVQVDESQQCMPDNPKLVAAVTEGTNNVPMMDLMDLGLSEDAVRKGEDLDGDGDPDVINITLEVQEINGRSPSGSSVEGISQEIAPGIRPGFWVFAPKTRGMATEGASASSIVRSPSPTIRVEESDRVNIKLENTHYFPHTIHFHGVDHDFEVNGNGNDGVPQVNGEPAMPGGTQEYSFSPEQPGSMFYHCHVQPNTHVLMGLQGMFSVEEERDNNTVQTFNIGGGKVRNPSEAVEQEYDNEYDMIYRGLDKELHNKIKKSNDPRVIAEGVNKEYDVTERNPDYYLLNGKSFPYTVRESQVVVEENETTKMRVLNTGSEGLSLHPHGHKPTATHYDGVEVDEEARIQRDVFDVSAAQRVDLEINSTEDGLNSYGPGAWFMHNHKEEAVTTDGIAPGGDVTLLTYKSYQGEENLPQKGVSWDQFFTEKYYEGEIPMWQGLSDKYGNIEVQPASTSTVVLIGLMGLILGALGAMVVV